MVLNLHSLSEKCGIVPP